MKRLILILSLLLMACSKKAPPQATPARKVVAAVPTVADTPRFKTYIGNAAARVSVDVRPQVEGVLTGYYFVEGQEVKQGDLLFTIDKRPYVAQLEKAQAALVGAMANLQIAQETAMRNAKLVQKEYVAQLQFDQYLTNVETAQAQIQASQADIDTANINITYCSIYAPVSGVIGQLQIDVGNLIQNGSSTPLTVLNAITPIYVTFSVPQNDLPEIMRLHRKSPLKVITYLGDENPEQFEGTLDLINNQVDTQTGSILMRGIFPNENKMLWPGEFTETRVILEVIKDALLIPTKAIKFTQKDTKIFVVKEDMTVELRTVVAGQRIGDQTVITSGLKAGEMVVNEGQINLAPGVKVTYQ